MKNYRKPISVFSFILLLLLLPCSGYAAETGQTASGSVWNNGLTAAAAELVQRSELLMELLILTDRFPLATHFVLLLMTILLAAGIWLLCMRKALSEKSAYNRYQEGCSHAWKNEDATLLYHRDPLPKNGGKKLSARVLRLAAVFLALIFILSEILQFVYLNTGASAALVAFTPLLLGAVLLLAVLLSVWLSGRVRRKLRTDRNNSDASPMQVQVIGKGRKQK